jgi:hypothetical protein
MQDCFFTTCNEYSAWTQVVKFHSSDQNITTEDFERCEARFLLEVLPEFQRGSERFAQLLVHLGKPKEIQESNGKTSFGWFGVDGTDHKIIKTYVRGAVSALASRSIVPYDESVIKEYVVAGEGFIHIPQGRVVSVATVQNMLLPWTKVRVLLTRLRLLFCKRDVYDIR